MCNPSDFHSYIAHFYVGSFSVANKTDEGIICKMSVLSIVVMSTNRRYQKGFWNASIIMLITSSYFMFEKIYKTNIEHSIPPTIYENYVT